jgi:NAD(P)H dehydrogenase (quinone)
MTIGVSGASGHLGAATVRHLKQRVTAGEIVGISRTPDTLKGLGVAGRYGDYDDSASLASAYAGLDRLVLIPTVDLRPGARAAQNLRAIDAAVAAGVKHIVYVSSLGTRAAPEPELWASYFATEQALMRKAPAWTVLRMGYYFESFISEAQQSLAHGALVGLADTRVAFVARDDIAAASAGILTGEGHHGAIYQGTGPAALTGTQRAAAVSAVAGKPLAFVVLPEEQLAAGLLQAGLPREIANVVISIQKGFAVGGFDLVSGDIERLSGRPPQKLETALAQAFRDGRPA